MVLRALHRITDSFRFEKTFKIIEFNCTTVVFTCRAICLFLKPLRTPDGRKQRAWGAEAATAGDPGRLRAPFRAGELCRRELSHGHAELARHRGPTGEALHFLLCGPQRCLNARRYGPGGSCRCSHHSRSQWE